MSPSPSWVSKIVSPETVLEQLKPGMSIFLGTGVVEPRTLIQALLSTEAPQLQDLELIQLVSMGDAVSLEEKYANKYRLKTFFAGPVTEALRKGRVDLIPSRFSKIPQLFESEGIHIDAAFIQITTPDADGFASLGPAVDVARIAMEKAALVVGEISATSPRTMGDSFVHTRQFDLLVESRLPCLDFPRWPVDDTFDRIGRNVAALIPDRSCISFGIGPLYEALARHLTGKQDLGVVTPMVTDALMELMESGAVTNRYKHHFRGKTLVSYAVGSETLMHWLDGNPLLEFQPIDVVGDPVRIGANNHLMVVLPARKIDFTGSVALHTGKGNIAAGPGESREYFTGAALSPAGHIIFGISSRNRNGASNIVPSVTGYPNQLNREELDLVVTEYGSAALSGKTVRERALALIDIAHPDDREQLIREAKAQNILYQTHVYTAGAHHYPFGIARTHTFPGNLTVRFRAIKPSDVDEMRRLFYRFSDQSVYYRYFSPIKTMPYATMQSYVSIDYQETLSIVGVAGNPGREHIIAEARYAAGSHPKYPELAFVVDEAHTGKGIGTFLFRMLTDIAKSRGLAGFTAEVLATNTAMLSVFEHSSCHMEAAMHSGVYRLTLSFPETQDHAR